MDRREDNELWWGRCKRWSNKKSQREDRQFSQPQDQPEQDTERDVCEVGLGDEAGVPGPRRA